LSDLADRATSDTNIVIYALAGSDKKDAAIAALRTCEFLSVQVLNEYASTAVRKRGLPWAEVAADVARLKRAITQILPIDSSSNGEALRLAERYRLSFYDCLMLAVALRGGARTIYSEDMQHGLLIDGTLRIVDPFR
jgi:predicted nucleic acid-binding protein